MPGADGFIRNIELDIHFRISFVDHHLIRTYVWISNVSIEFGTYLKQPIVCASLHFINTICFLDVVIIVLSGRGS